MTLFDQLSTLLSFALRHPFLALVSLTFLLIASLALFLAYRIFVSPRRLAVWNVPGPTHLESILFGSMIRQINETSAGQGNESFLTEYGSTVRFSTILGGTRIISKDPGFVNHVIKNSYSYPKNILTTSYLSLLLSSDYGLIVSEGDTHRRIRRVLAPAFSQESTKRLTPLFLEKSYELRGKLLETVRLTEKVEKGETSGTDMDVMVWLSRATLDIIGLAGFDYDFNSLNDSTNELQMAFKQMFEATHVLSPMLLLQLMIPPLRVIPTKEMRAFDASKQTITRIGNEMVRRKKRAAVEADANEGKNGVAKDLLEGRDVLSQLVRSNMASDLPASQKLSDEEVGAQIATVVLAGFETSSTAMTWFLYALSNNPSIQDKLRAELLACQDEMPSLDTLNSLPYLDACVREVLRLHAPVPGTDRRCTKTDTIPLSKPVMGKDGNLITELVMEEGVTISIPILAINRSKEIWGEDAEEFKPERWLSPLPILSTQDYEGVWAHLLTFIFGPRGCPGYRFSLAEIKSLTFVLLRTFAFSPVVSDPPVVYRSKASVVQRPIVVGREEEGYQMVLRVREVESGR